jgi:formate hydrogenlyase subunit 4
MIGSLLELITLIALPPLLLGVIVKTKALFAGRVGAPVLQLYYDLFKLFRKSTVTSRTTSWVFAAGPVVALATTLLAAVMLPTIGAGAAPLHFAGNVILFAYLLALGRFFTTAAALDTSSAFEGMGSAREITFACLAEPAMFFGLLVLARMSSSMNLSNMLAGGVSARWMAAGAPLVLVIAALFLVLLVENCRIPFDDPNTHLELTMIHEAMVLDHSGPALGIILYAAAMKLFVFGALVLRIAAPVTTGHVALDWLAFCAGMVIIAVAVGVVESVMARLRLVHIPTLLIAACLLGGFGLLLSVRG